MVGPFIFFDHFGPAEFRAGQGIDVRPHPHIGLATVTFLFDGEIMHRDSLGTAVAIRPGEVNWMTAGRGIVHSERTAPSRQGRGRSTACNAGWRCRPRTRRPSPASRTTTATALPLVSGEGKTVRVVAGRAYGERSPVPTLSDTLFADVTLAAGATLPVDAEHRGARALRHRRRGRDRRRPASAGRLLICAPGDPIGVTRSATRDASLLGGAAMDGPRHIWWNFVSSRKERIEQAKADWKLGRFDSVPGDEEEFIPLPEERT